MPPRRRTFIAAAFAVSVAACNRSAETPPKDERGAAPPSSSPAATSAVEFVDVTAASGVGFVHENGAYGKKLLPETMGSGVAMLDADGDGKIDLFFVNQRRWPGREKEYASPESAPARCKFFRNKGNLQFEDATDASGLGLSLCGMGAAVGDLDGDGDDDLIVTALGDTRLMINQGGRFEDAAAARGLATPKWKDKSGTEHPMWGTSAAVLDYNNDGVLDVFIAAYVKWSEGTDIWTTLDGTHKAYTTPDLYPGDSCRLYRGAGGGRFEDVTESAGVLNASGKSLGAATYDFDGNGWIDIVVANDTQPNFLYLNEGGKFRDAATEAGVAYDVHGRARAGMGIDVARVRAGGPLAIAIGNFSGEGLSYFYDRGKTRFEDDAATAGVDAPTKPSLTFGLAYYDFDLDGRLDLVLANGHIEPTVHDVRPEWRYAQAPQYFQQSASGRFDDVSASAGAAFRAALVGRGLSVGDLDGDGDGDLVMTRNGGAAVVYRCDRKGAAAENKVLVVRLQGPPGNRDGDGAVVRATFAGRTEERVVKRGASYLSQSSVDVHIGLGSATAADRIEVRWPGGAVQTFEHVAAGAAPLIVRKSP